MKKRIYEFSLKCLDRLYVPIPEIGCFMWFGAINITTGYGIIKIDGKQWLAHRAMYIIEKGEILEGLVLDHLCRNRWCVNPNHLEPVTHKTNILRGIGFSAVNSRKTHCPNGHIYDDENTHISKQGYRRCRACDRDRWGNNVSRQLARNTRRRELRKISNKEMQC